MEILYQDYSAEEIWEDKSIYIKGFYGWKPHQWASLGFDIEHRKNIKNNTTNPFICIIYITKNSDEDKKNRGKIMGFYLVSHEEGDRDEFTAPILHTKEPLKWRKAIRAVRAFEFLPEYRKDMSDFFESFSDIGMPLARTGKVILNKDGELSNEKFRFSFEQIEKLKSIPYREVPIFHPKFGESHGDYSPLIFPNPKNKVRGGNVNHSGYIVEGEPLDTPKELYALRLHGSHLFLGGCCCMDRDI